MTRITWGDPGTRLYEAGVDRGVLYVGSNPGVPWNGLIEVSQEPSGGEAKPYYIDGVKISNRSTPEELEGTIEAYTYPTEFEPCCGISVYQHGLRIGHQLRSEFSLVYRTKVGNDIDGLDHAYKIHLLYNLKVSPNERSDITLDDDQDLNSFSWDFTSRGVLLPGHRPTSYFELDSRRVPEVLMSSVEEMIYGTETSDPVLPRPAELLFMFDAFEDLVYDAGTTETPVFSVHDAGNVNTAVATTIDSGGT